MKVTLKMLEARFEAYSAAEDFLFAQAEDLELGPDKDITFTSYSYVAGKLRREQIKLLNKIKELRDKGDTK